MLDKMFCNSCGSILKKQDGVMKCTNCDNTQNEDTVDKYVSKTEQEDSEVIESDEDANFEGKPVANDVRCDECENNEAWYTIKQTASADEPPTRFFKCTDCGNRWREYN